MKSEERRRVLAKLNDMIHYVEELEMMLPSKDDYLLDLVKRRACEKTVEAAIETLVDVAAMIVSFEKLGLPADLYEPCKSQPSFDKQYVRDYLSTTNWDKNSSPPHLPDEVVAETQNKYKEAYEKITDKKFDF